MQIGMIGLGRMGMNMALRLLEGGHAVVAYNRTPQKVREVEKRGAAGAYSIRDLVSALRPPRTVWIMIPAGKPVDDAIGELKGLLKKGDLVIDGGNSFWGDALRRAEELKALGVDYMDVGVSGGVWGLKEGYCLMSGGEARSFRRVLPAIKTLAQKGGYLHCGPVGSGHFVKMVHNGIEYALMAAYGEGFAILNASPFAERLDLEKIAAMWNHGSVIRSWLLELIQAEFKEDPRLQGIEGYVEDSGEGRWTVNQAVNSGVPATLIASSLFQRFRSRQEDNFADRVVAAMRHQFGGHAVRARKRGRKRGGRG
ncbi:MAG: decarboxylating 6-phosphogluconate dehydrogenase [Thermodesulfovibrionales bacterium]